MKFFLKIIDTWLRQQGIAYALYGADGQALSGSEAGGLPAQFIPEERNGRSCPFPIGFAIQFMLMVITVGVGVSSMMDGM